MVYPRALLETKQARRRPQNSFLLFEQTKIEPSDVQSLLAGPGTLTTPFWAVGQHSHNCWTGLVEQEKPQAGSVAGIRQPAVKVKM